MFSFKTIDFFTCPLKGRPRGGTRVGAEGWSPDRARVTFAPPADWFDAAAPVLGLPVALTDAVVIAAPAGGVVGA